MEIKKILKIFTGFCLINIATAAIGEGFARANIIGISNQNIFAKGNKNFNDGGDLDKSDSDNNNLDNNYLDNNRKILARKRLDKAEKDSAQENIDKLTTIENNSIENTSIENQAVIRSQLDD